MKRLKIEPSSTRRCKLSHILLAVGAIYLVFLALKFPHFLEIASMLSVDDSYAGLDSSSMVKDVEDSDLSKPSFSSVYKDAFHRKLEDNQNQNAPMMPSKEPLEDEKGGSKTIKPLQYRYGRITGGIMRRRNATMKLSPLERMADEAWLLGLKAWEEVEKYDGEEIGQSLLYEGKIESCPLWVSMSGEELAGGDKMMFLPCGLAAGSSITIVGTPHHAHQEYVPQLARMQWGTAQRCDGLPSKKDEDMLVDEHVRCEKWMRDDNVDSKESKTASWFKRFIGREQKPEVTWPFPFVEGGLFILTLRAGVDGYHITVGGRHVTSFPYRPGFTLEDATGLAIKGDVDVHSVFATSLPSSHPSFSPQRVLEMSEKWKAHPLPKSPLQLFIGILSATNHFAERMAVRKTWMQSSVIKSSNVVARFFVALNPRKEVNAVLKREAAYFGDIVILPFMDRYELVVLKTIAICEFGVQNVSAAYIMKCDDDTFVRVDTVLKEIDRTSPNKSLYMGNLNLLHRPLRNGKWAVTFEEWPEEVYPPYANGPGYVISTDIAKFVIAQHGKRSLRLHPCSVLPQLEILSIRMLGELLYRTLPIPKADDLSVGQVGERSGTMLQL
ncbi:hypothetical protein D5086_011917 [Populus alba]|uniref:Uncharacterized protein n=1 Tax=Populus alba TaxID=43335 RepID=A0ACC4C293_POPAL